MISLLGEGKLNNLLAVLKTAPHEGYIAEVGVYKGGTLKEMAKCRPDTPCFGFDTFEGLPREFDGEDEVHTPCEFSAAFIEVAEYVKECANVVLVQGLFPRSGSVWGPFSFVHLDIDQWRGTKAAIDFLWPQMISGGIIFFDDYDWKNCPGIKFVVDEFAKSQGLEVNKVSQHQVYLVKP